MRLLIVGLALAAVGVSSWLVSDALASLDIPLDRHGGAFVGSAACARCHPDHHESWARTHHRRMTRDATTESVLASFDGRTLDYGGYTARMTREGERFVVEVGTDRDVLARWTVERVVGSRRHQQFLAREDDLWVRLPIAWDVEEQRFFHMNGAFLTPDPARLDEDAPIDASDYMRHAVRWNDNCVFCHNVGAEPRADGHGHFDTRVAELGVACEACHGPGADHVRANTSPFRRYALHETERADPTITSPSRLSPARSGDVCGRCHGQRMTSDVSRYLAHGDPFVPGEALSEYSTPLARDTALHGDTTAFATRFWSEGTPRLTAYEYQALALSRCAIDGDVTCTDCHAMHAGDPLGQIRPDRIGDAMCAGACHSELATPGAAREHAHHDDVRCIECHMPAIVFGIRSLHPSHRIDVPQRAGRPDACTLCHVERDEIETMLFGGDPIERAVAASALGRPLGPAERASRRIGLLLTTMQSDSYPAVRGIAWRSVRAIEPGPIASFTATDDASERALQIGALDLHFDRPDAAQVERLHAQADARAIEIGE